MANAGNVRAGGAFVEIFAKDGQFQQAMTKVQNRLKAIGASMRTFGAGLMGVGAGIVTPILGAANAFATFGSELYDMSVRTGVAAEQLSVLKFAAEQTGTDMAGVETAVKKMQKAIFAAGNGSKEAADALAMVGLSAADLEGKSADEQMGLIADGLMRIEDPGTRAAIAMAIFGKAGTSILPMLEGGSAGMAQFAAEAKRLGLVLDQQAAAKADELGDAMDAMRAAMRMAFREIGSAVAPMLTALAKNLATAAAAVGNFIREHQQLVAVALRVGAGIAALGGVVYGIGTAFGIVSRAIGGAMTVLRVLPLLFTPIGLAASAAFAVVAGGIAIARQLSPAFRRETDGIMTALMRLDFGAAWEIMNLNFAIALTKMAAKADSVLRKIRNIFSDAAKYIGDTIGGAFERAMAAMGFDVGAAGGGDKPKPPSGEADQAAAGWAATINELNAELDRVHARLSQADAGAAAGGPQPGRPGGAGDFSMSGGAAAGIGQTAGTFSGMAGLGIGPELNTMRNDAAATAENTGRAANALDRIAQAMVQPMPAGGGVAAEVAAPRAPAVVAAAQAGTAAAASQIALGSIMSDGFKAVVESIAEHAKLTKAGNGSLESIDRKLSSAGLAFS